MKATTALLCEANCAVRGRHIGECDRRDACRGCQPRQAADGLRLCIVHADRVAADARDTVALHADLALVLIRRGRGGEGVSGSSSGAPVPDEDVMEARAAIRSTLIQLTKVITSERGVRAPLAMRGRKPYIDTRPEALGPFVARHARWLAAHTNAGRYANLLHEATHGDVCRIAYPVTSDRIYIGDCPLVRMDIDDDASICGARLYQRAGEPAIQCGGCGTVDNIEQWQSWMVGEVDGVTDAYAIAAHLSLQWMRPVDPALIRQWCSRGRIHPVMEPDPTDHNGQRWRVVVDDKRRTQYEIEPVIAYAESIWGPPYRGKRAE